MYKPSDEQRAAAQSTRPNLMVVAPPGCGKTELLAYRAEALIPRLAPNQKILALTFTNRAQVNLRERMRTVLGGERSRRFVVVRNFHGHAAQIVRAHGRTIGLDTDTLVQPTSKTLSKALLAAESDWAVRKDAAALLASMKRSPLTDAEVISALQSATDRPGQAVALTVEVDRQVDNQLHYEDLLRHAQRLLSIDTVARLYCLHYGAVLVDEFQDLSLQQLDVVARSCNTSRMFAGDPTQGIYSWAGADPEGVEQVLRPACGGPVRLTTSYRSSPAVLAMLNSVSTQLGAVTLACADEARWHEGGFGAVHAFRDREHEAKSVVYLARLVLDRDPNATVGVITRSGWRRSEIDAAFASAPEIPTRRWDLAIEDPSVVDLIRRGVAALPRGIAFEDACASIIGRLDASDVDTIEQVQDAFEQLVRSGVKTVSSALKGIRSPKPDEAVSSGVHLLNAHTGKGQQFDWVIVVGLEERHVPDRRNSTGAALAEEFRVLLVMLSRARHGLIVTKVNSMDGMYGPYAPKASRWYAGLNEVSSSALNTFKSHVEEM